MSWKERRRNRAHWKGNPNLLTTEVLELIMKSSSGASSQPNSLLEPSEVVYEGIPV